MVSWVRLGKQSRSFLCKQNWCRNLVTLSVKFCLTSYMALKFFTPTSTLTLYLELRLKERTKKKQTDRQADRQNLSIKADDHIAQHSNWWNRTHHSRWALDLLMFHYHVQLHVKLGQWSRMLIRALDSYSDSVLWTSARLLHVDSARISLPCGSIRAASRICSICMMKLRYRVLPQFSATVFNMVL